MPAFQQIPLGTPIPDSPHAVSCSLPTMAAVRGYEEKDPAVTSRLRSGYPRFVVHPFARRLTDEMAKRAGLRGRTLWLASSRRMAAALLADLSSRGQASGAQLFEAEGAHGVTHPDSRDQFLASKLFLQNVGGFISSREAEDRLAALGVGPLPAAEEVFRGDSQAECLGHLRPLFKGTTADDLVLTASGMNAVYSAFRAIDAEQRPRGRTAWVQLGWLYLDTIAILRRFAARASDYIHLPDVLDAGALERLLAGRSGSVAGVIAEIPTNPLVQTPDVLRLAELCRRHSVRLVLDPSLSSAFSVDCLPHADVVVSSLTKYTGSEGDVIAGLAAVNPSGPDAAALRRRIREEAEPLYRRDLSRLAWQIGSTAAVLAAVEASAPAVASFLEAHPAVKSVNWALTPATRSQYLQVARRTQATGGIISFTLRGSLDAFYDRLRLPKGPSFGMRTTLICPFMYLAHYDLVSTPEGRRELEANGLDPNLLRLCVGTEPASEIIGALSEALGP
ncbi:MAG TPA: PLP-dependent transferase [Opitutaceae bacterium]|jgi:cystathionine gamma-synthase